MARVFLSHAFADFSGIQPILNEFRRKGVDYWISEEQIPDGRSIPNKINEALAACSHLLVFWSQAASQSRVTQDEVGGFYLRPNTAGRVLFVRLDATPVPALYAAATYVPTGQLPAQIAQRVKVWLSDDGLAGTAIPTPLPPTTPPHPLQYYPIGPMIEAEYLTEDLIRGFADNYGTQEPANDLINRANRFRLTADPSGNRTSMLLLAGDLPGMAETSPYTFWSRALNLARKKSRRMLAALLQECDTSSFQIKALADHRNLVKRLEQPN